ncbi:alpha-galactosidase [Streptomyces clavuligerus]|nr:alpha-galactosidase [Streptomyces clavuligerus]
MTVRHRPHRLAPAALAATAVLLGLVAAPAHADPPPPPAAAGVTALAPTPPMGFNNWNSTHCRPEFNETMIKGVADTLVAKGLRDAGYRYVNLDDCWALPQRNAAGDLVPDPVRFPSGIKALADYVHAKGLKFGIYSSAGTRTCDVQGFPGGLGNERRDAALWASWGVDYLKYDNCHNNGVDARQRYRAMAEALRATGREILLSVCEWGENAPWEWAGEYGSAWRTTGDIADTWDSMLGIARRNQELAPYARPGAWNDPDMLEVGNGGMTDTEYRTHFSLWSQMAAPLLIGSDLRTATPATLEILTNREVIAVNQDPLGRQGTVVSRSGGLVVMTKPLADGGRSVTLTNETAAARTVTTTAEAIGLGGSASYTLRDLWTRQNRTTADTIAATVPAHGTVMYRVTPGEPVPPPHGLSRVGDLRRLSADSNWGPVERDRSNGEQAPGDGRPLTVGGTAYARGLGVHAPSTIGYHLGGACRNPHRGRGCGRRDDGGRLGGLPRTAGRRGGRRQRAAHRERPAAAAHRRPHRRPRAAARGDRRRRRLPLGPRRLGRAHPRLRPGPGGRYPGAQHSALVVGGGRLGSGGTRPQQRRTGGGRRPPPHRRRHRDRRRPRHARAQRHHVLPRWRLHPAHHRRRCGRRDGAGRLGGLPGPPRRGRGRRQRTPHRRRPRQDTDGGPQRRARTPPRRHGRRGRHDVRPRRLARSPARLPLTPVRTGPGTVPGTRGLRPRGPGPAPVGLRHRPPRTDCHAPDFPPSGSPAPGEDGTVPHEGAVPGAYPPGTVRSHRPCR